jgi:hypothetical protein
MSPARLVLPLLLLLANGCQQVAPLPTTPSPSGTAPLSPTPALATETPATGGVPTASAAPPPSTAVAGVRANALGAPTGNWIFAAKQVFDLPQPEIQIFAIPISGGITQLAASYDVPSGGAPEAPIDNAPYLRRMFSPDGRRLVVSVNGRLAILDLPSGTARALGSAGVFPSWSRDGSRIAFLIPVPNPLAIGPDLDVAVVAADGGPVRIIARLDGGPQSLEWSPDSSFLLVPQRTGVGVVEVASGRTVRTLDLLAGPAPSFTHWRAGAPELALAPFGCVDFKSLVSLDRVSAPIRTLVQSPARGDQCLLVHDPRWNPAANELLYVASRMMDLCCLVHVLDIASGKDATLPVEASQATWTADGAQIVYITPSRGASFGDAVRVWPRDGRRDRTILVAMGFERIVSVASLAY